MVLNCSDELNDSKAKSNIGNSSAVVIGSNPHPAPFSETIKFSAEMIDDVSAKKCG